MAEQNGEFVVINGTTRRQRAPLLARTINVFASIFLDETPAVAVVSRIWHRISDFVLILQLDKAVKGRIPDFSRQGRAVGFETGPGGWREAGGSLGDIWTVQSSWERG